MIYFFNNTTVKCFHSVAVGILILLHAVQPVFARVVELKSPLLISKSGQSEANGTLSACPPRIRALKDMSDMYAFYVPDSTMSVIDPQKMSDYSKKIWPINEVKKVLSTLSVTALNGPDDTRKVARRCITAQISLWSENDALLSGLENNNLLGHRQAILEIIWASIIFSNGYALANQISPLDYSGKEKADVWFSKLLPLIMAEFTPREREKKDQWLDARSNQWLWAGASVASLAVLLNDRPAFEWSIDILKLALDEAPVDGTLPSELKRGQRSLHYQNFAMAAISIMVATADANGIQLSDKQEVKLKALATFTADAFENPSIIEDKTGKTQEKRASMITWAAALSLHFKVKDPSLSQRLKELVIQAELSEKDFCSLVCVGAYLSQLE